MSTSIARLAAASLLLLTAMAQAVTYQITDLGAFPSKKNLGRSHGLGINASGVTVGSASGSVTGDQRPALFKGGVAIDLALRAGVALDGRGTAYGINQKQQITGFIEDAVGQHTAFIEDHGTMSLIPMPVNSGGVAINRSGDLIANSFSAECHCGYFVHAGTATLLPVPRPELTLSYEALALNDQGWVAGSVTELKSRGVERTRAALWHQGRIRFLADWGGKGGAIARGLNAQREVVGQASTEAGDTHAFLYRDGVMTDLDAVPGSFSRAQAINGASQIVGRWIVASRSGGFVTIDGAMAWLTDLVVQPIGSKWVVDDAFGINDAGQIVAHATNSSLGLNRAVLLTPVP